MTTIDAAAEINLPTTDAAQSTELKGEQPKNTYKSSNSKSSNSKNPKKTKKQKFQLLQSENGNNLSPTVHSFDLWLSSKNMKRIPHQTSQYGNCLYESVANCIQLWEGKQVELRLQTKKIGHVYKLHREHNGEEKFLKLFKIGKETWIIMGNIVF